MNHIFSAILQGTDTHHGSPRSPSLCSSKFCSSQCTNIINKHKIQMKIRKKGEYLACKDLKLPKRAVLHVVDQSLSWFIMIDRSDSLYGQYFCKYGMYYLCHHEKWNMEKGGGCTCVYLYWWFPFCPLVLHMDCCSWMTFFLIMFISSQSLISKVSDTVELYNDYLHSGAKCWG